MTQKDTRLEQSLAQLRTRLVLMGASVGIAIEQACEAIRKGDLGKAETVQEEDRTIDALENEIDEMSLGILARNQPVAQDLRFVVAALRMVKDLERMGDEAASMAERVLILRTPLPQGVLAAITPLMREATELCRQALEAFQNQDDTLALKVRQSEDEASQNELTALQRLMDSFCSPCGGNDETARAVMHGILICRALNRICRRAANIAEHTYFITQGIDIKHSRLEEEQ